MNRFSIQFKYRCFPKGGTSADLKPAAPLDCCGAEKKREGEGDDDENEVEMKLVQS